jgi:hypothetical protein
VSQQALKGRAISVAEGKVVFVHVHSLPDIHENVDKLN